MNRSQLIQSVGKIPVLSHGLRWCANLYPENSVVQIRAGHAAGLLWRRHHRYVNGYWLGHYELPIQEALRRELFAGGTFFDIGANAGFFTIVAARLVGPGGRCVAFEPSPDNCASIREQIETNALDYCTLVPEAVAEAEGTAKFSFSAPGSPMGHLGGSRGGERQIEVKTTTLDAACARFGAPDVIKMDIDGAEIGALQSAVKTLRDIRPAWLIELHGPDCEREVKAALCRADYSFFDLDGRALPANELLPQHFLAHPN